MEWDDPREYHDDALDISIPINLESEAWRE